MELYDGYDPKSLFVLKTIIEEKSRHKASLKLGINESSIQYRLSKLRDLTNDLLIKSEHGVVSPTKRGLSLYRTACKIHELLAKENEHDSSFSYDEDKRNYVIFCNDLFGSLVGPYLLDKSYSIGTICLSLYIVPDVDDSPIGNYFSEFYYSLLNKEVIDLVILSDFSKLDYPGVKRTSILKTSMEFVTSLQNHSVIETDTIRGGEVFYNNQSDSPSRVSSFKVIEEIINSTLFEGPLPKQMVDEGYESNRNKNTEIKLFQYWNGHIADDKENAFLRKLIKSVCRELLFEN